MIRRYLKQIVNTDVSCKFISGNRLKIILFLMIMYLSTVPRGPQFQSGFLIWAPGYVIFIITLCGTIMGYFIWKKRYLPTKRYLITLLGINLMVCLLFVILYWLH